MTWKTITISLGALSQALTDIRRAGGVVTQCLPIGDTRVITCCFTSVEVQQDRERRRA